MTVVRKWIRGGPMGREERTCQRTVGEHKLSNSPNRWLIFMSSLRAGILEGPRTYSRSTLGVLQEHSMTL